MNKISWFQTQSNTNSRGPSCSSCCIRSLIYLSCNSPSEGILLKGRVAIVIGAQRGLGLEMAEALAEAGATVYCLDLPGTPDPSFEVTRMYVEKMKGRTPSSRLEYASVDVTNQEAIWELVAEIARKEGRLDLCVAAAGILRGEECLDYSAEGFEQLMRVNVNGVLYTAQASGRQMSNYGTPGSIVVIASTAGSGTLRVLVNRF